MNRELILVVDFGGQYNQLIARRVREHNVYCEILPYTASISKIKDKNPKGIIFTGGPNSVYGEDSPRISKEIFDLNVPVLGICYGHQLISYLLGGTIESPEIREYGKANINLNTKSPLFEGIEEENSCWMSHTDQVTKAPE